MIENSKIGVIILAAGSSSRLGHPKQLVRFKGKSLLQQVIDLADSFKFDSQILVLGANSEEITRNIDPRKFKIVINENWKEGMSTSIKTGLSESLKLEKDLDQILILLSDQPFVNRENIEELLGFQLNANKKASFSEYNGDIGVPAIFSRELFSELQKLEGDHGAKKLFCNKNLNYQALKIENGNFDVDTLEDVEKLRELEKE